MRRNEIIAALALLLILTGCSMAAMPSPSTRHNALDAVVVLGNRPPVDKAGKLRAESRVRLERGVALWRQKVAPSILFTGGDFGDGRSEAEVLAAHALDIGVSESAVFKESRSTNTMENAAFSYALMCGGRGASCAPRIALVTTPFHAWRAHRLFECAGFVVESYPASSPAIKDQGDIRSKGANTSYARSFSLYEWVASAFPSMSDQCAHVHRLVNDQMNEKKRKNQ